MPSVTESWSGSCRRLCLPALPQVKKKKPCRYLLDGVLEKLQDSTSIYQCFFLTRDYVLCTLDIMAGKNVSSTGDPDKGAVLNLLGRTAR